MIGVGEEGGVERGAVLDVSDVIVIPVCFRECNCSYCQRPQFALQFCQRSGGCGRATEIPSNNLRRNEMTLCVDKGASVST